MQERLDRLVISKMVKESFKITRIYPKYSVNRPISARLAICYEGATPPRPAQSDLLSSIAGAAHRVASQAPTPNRKMVRKFKRFVALWLRRNLKPLENDDVRTFDEWLDGTSYDAARKAELRRAWSKCSSKPTKRQLSIVKSFIKDECYETYKNPRGIYSRSDVAKCTFGPLVQSISDKLFALPWFIKTVPVNDRPMVIYDSLNKHGATYCYTDYTAYEAHFEKFLMDACESLMFRYMTSRLGAQYRKVVEMMRDCKVSINRIIFKTFCCQVEACRMSGEMDTSLSNGFTNLMLYLFASREAGCPEERVKGFVEGDDGLFRNDGPFPTEKIFEDLGMTIKIGLTQKLEHASFCGQVYSLDDLIVVTDVREQVCRLGWTTKNYVMSRPETKLELLRSRGYSLVYQYGGCPILGVLGKRILELTDGVNIRNSIVEKMDLWSRERLLKAMKWKQQIREPGLPTRQLVEKLYGVPVQEQINIECEISNMGFGSLPFVFSNIPADWEHYWNTYNCSEPDEEPIWIPQRKDRLIRQLRKVGALKGVEHLDFRGDGSRI